MRALVLSLLAIGLPARGDEDMASCPMRAQHMKESAHLQEVNRRGDQGMGFAAGDFRLPMFIHGRTPPGVATMRKLKSQIAYHYEATASGARVRISTTRPKALAAVHAFLRFQIADHQTGDSTAVQPHL